MPDALSDLGEFYDAFAPKIYRYLYHRLGDQAVAQDLTSEAFVRLLHARVMPDSASAYLYRIAHNLCVDFIRHARRWQPLDDNLVGHGGDPVQFAEIELERAQLRRALLRLTPDQQQAIVLKYLEGLSNEEIAQVLGKPVGAVKALQHRGLNTLRILLSPEIRRDWQPGHVT